MSVEPTYNFNKLLKAACATNETDRTLLLFPCGFRFVNKENSCEMTAITCTVNNC